MSRVNCHQQIVTQFVHTLKHDKEFPQSLHDSFLSITGVKDIVQLAGFDSMKKGVIALNITGRTIYDITPNFYGQVSTPTVFSPLWPEKFSVLGRIRPRKTKYPREGQYLISLTDSSGRLYLGLKAFPSPTLEILHKTGRMSSVSIPLPHDNINDGQWHQFGFGINGNNITMYYNCYARTVQILQSEPFIPNIYQSTMIIGSKMFAMDRGADERYEVSVRDNFCSITRYILVAAVVACHHYPINVGLLQFLGYKALLWI